MNSLRLCLSTIVASILFVYGNPLYAQQTTVPVQEVPAQTGVTTADGIVTFAKEFFTLYQPKTALEMVNRVPGFTLNDGGGVRGFGGAAGNILINDKRPSAKQDLPSAILGRISASQVERIELIRVRVRDIDLQGQVEVVNVVLSTDAPATVRWELQNRQNFLVGWSPGASISLADRLGDIEYNVGFDTRWANLGDPGVIKKYDGTGKLTEIRTDEDQGDGPNANAYLNAATWIGKSFVQLNGRTGIENRDLGLQSTRVSQLTGVTTYQDILTIRRNKRLELGMDAERVLTPVFLGKAIVLYNLLDGKPSVSQRDFNSARIQTRYQLEDEEFTSTEFIGRMEFDWAGIEGHAIEANAERAFNVLDNSQVFTDDTGKGPKIIAVPGGNVRVEEVRWNYLVQDSWSIGKLDVETGLGLERSTISQSGDATLERSFKFLKPRMVLTWAPVRGNQTRLRLEREVSQLDFNDFTSATVFEDDDVALGNPNLHPDSTWISELSHERRFGRVGVIKVTAFHHWIKDVLDLLPLTPTFEAPGNIGDGRRWGMIVETTVPLDWTGLDSSQISFRARRQDSTVVDPVTGEDRRLSGEGGFRGDWSLMNENRYAFDVDFRQDIKSAKVSWGWGVAERDERALYKANELDIFDEGYDVMAFIETTRWFGLKMSVEGQNMIDNRVKRDRTIYTGERSLTPVLRRELRDGHNGARALFKIVGSF